MKERMEYARWLNKNREERKTYRGLCAAKLRSRERSSRARYKHEGGREDGKERMNFKHVEGKQGCCHSCKNCRIQNENFSILWNMGCSVEGWDLHRPG